MDEASKRIESLELQLQQLQSRSPATGARQQSAGTGSAIPAGGTRVSGTPMPVNIPAAPTKTLASDLDTPVKIQKVLDQMNINDLRLALNGEHDKLRLAMLYQEIQKRRELVSQ